MSEAVHAVDNLITVQTHEDAPNTIDANRRDRVKEFSDKRISNNGQKTTETFFAEVIKESEMM